jgi:hypothetical protein
MQRRPSHWLVSGQNTSDDVNIHRDRDGVKRDWEEKLRRGLPKNYFEPLAIDNSAE